MSNKNELRRPLIFMLVTTSILLGLYSDLNKEVFLSIDGQTLKVNTLSNTVGDLLLNKKIKLKESCIIEPSLDSKIQNNMDIVITNKINVQICDEGVKKEYKTTKSTVEEILKELNINLNDRDIVNKKLNENIKSNDTIEITRVKEEEVVLEKEIPFEVSIIKDSSKAKGSQVIKNEGEDGKVEKKYKIVYKNGNVFSKELISEKIVKKPINKVIKEGTLDANTI